MAKMAGKVTRALYLDSRPGKREREKQTDRQTEIETDGEILSQANLLVSYPWLKFTRPFFGNNFKVDYIR